MIITNEMAQRISANVRRMTTEPEQYKIDENNSVDPYTVGVDPETFEVDKATIEIMFAMENFYYLGARLAIPAEQVRLIFGDKRVKEFKKMKKYCDLAGVTAQEYYAVE